MTDLIVFSVIFLAMFIEGMIGFGSALITMPVLLQLIGVRTAPPAFSMLALCTGILMLLRYRAHWQFQAVWRILLAAVIAIPLGIVLGGIVNEHLAMLLLGLLVVSYALYALFAPTLPEIKNPRWAYVAGFFSGLTHGAYAIAGPPLVIYGNASRWRPQEFKSNLQSVFFINGILIVAAHFVKGNVTPDVLHYFAVMLPGGASGLCLGFWLDRYVKPETFRRAVLVLLVFLGISLMLK